jgi:hypothetical protein
MIQYESHKPLKGTNEMVQSRDSLEGGKAFTCPFLSHFDVNEALGHVNLNRVTCKP